DDSDGAMMDVDSDEETGSAGGVARRGLRASRRIRRARSGTYSVGETAWDAEPAIAGLSTRRSGRGRPRNGGRNVDLLEGEEADGVEANVGSVTSDDEFRPARRVDSAASGARGSRRRGRPRISRDLADSAETAYSTRNRRIASDSESDNAADTASTEEQHGQSDESDYSTARRSRSQADADVHVDIMPSSDVEDHSPYSSRSHTRHSERRGRRMGNQNGAAAAREAIRTRTRPVRSSINGNGVRDREDLDTQSDNEASTPRAVPGRADQRSSHVQVPRSVDIDDLYSDEPSASDSGRGRYADGAQRQQSRYQKRQRRQER
ncbi:hypothetical protein LPJ56_007320, partial [Coemansia sp. RSA 2599]